MGNYVKSLGKHEEVETLIGDVKLKEGAGVTITRVDEDNALEIASAVGEYEGFGNHWQKLDPHGMILGSLNFNFDQVSFSVKGNGALGALYSESSRCRGLSAPHSCRFKITRGHSPTGLPYGWFCLVKDDPDLYNNLNQEHIGFRSGSDDQIYCTNANGTARTQTGPHGGLWPPRWVKWVRHATDIEFYVDGVLKATHTTNLPTLTNSAFFTFEINGRSDYTHALYMTVPTFGVD